MRLPASPDFTLGGEMTGTLDGVGAGLGLTSSVRWKTPEWGTRRLGLGEGDGRTAVGRTGEGVDEELGRERALVLGDGAIVLLEGSGRSPAGEVP